MMKTLASLAAALLLAACATHRGPTPINDDTLHIVRHGFATTTSIRKEIVQEATDYCAQQGKKVEVVDVITNTPPYVNLKFPKAEVQFRCMPRQGFNRAGR